MDLMLKPEPFIISTMHFMNNILIIFNNSILIFTVFEGGGELQKEVRNRVSLSLVYFLFTVNFPSSSQTQPLFAKPRKPSAIFLALRGVCSGHGAVVFSKAPFSNV